jgi:hypothetical protein
VKPEERAARRGIMWVARILIGIVLIILLTGAVKWVIETW